MEKKTCWEFFECGREPGGANVDELGVCPAAVETDRDTTNKGKNGGRICWAVAGTLCKGEIQGSFAKKLVACVECRFYKKVRKEEGKAFEIY
ncbi:MAG: hypothetical protein WBA22_01065 [Candidatus Methanofastidiosia archaeon]